LRGHQAQHACAEHVISGANTQYLGKLLKKH
jgi:hypothetical protein